MVEGTSCSFSSAVGCPPFDRHLAAAHGLPMVMVACIVDLALAAIGDPAIVDDIAQD